MDGRPCGATATATVIEIRRAADRSVTHQPGITTWHSFSAGAHYDPANIGFGSLIASDEHLLEPGAGFQRHAHRGVELVSWVLDGVLRHEDCPGRAERVGAGTIQHQSAGSGILHVERNASAIAPLRFLQMSLLGGTAEPTYALHHVPRALRIGAADLSVLRLAGACVLPAAPFVYVQVVSGHAQVDEGGLLRPADAVRVTAQPLTLRGAAELLVWRMPERS